MKEYYPYSDRYCLYLRKSRSDLEAENEEDTLARHEKALLDLARRQKLSITSIYKEVVSGDTISSRPVMQKLLSEVEQGIWKGVLVVEVERLARGDTIDQGIVAQAFKFSSTKIITPSKTYDPNNEFDEEYFEFGLFMSRREYKTINRRLQRGRIASVNEGKYVGNVAPYGYKRVKLEGQKGYTLEPIENQAEIVKLIYQFYTDNDRIGVSLIAKKLNGLGIPALKSSQWTQSTIIGILTNPVYIGKVRWNWRKTVKKIENGEVKRERPRAKPEDCILVDGLHPPIIDIDVWNKAKAYMSANPPRPVNSLNTIKNPLAGIVKCSACGKSMIRRPYSSNQRATLMCINPSCDNISSFLYLVEERILLTLKEYLEAYKLEWGNKESSPRTGSSKNDILKRAESEQKTLQAQLDNLHDLLEQGIYTKETFLERNAKLLNKISACTSQIENIKNEMVNEINSLKTQEEVIPRLENVLRLYEDSNNLKLKNELLKSVVEEAFYNKSVNARWHNNLDDFTLDITPRF
ncbi:MAG: resolvase [Oscillospiraceae bacterium]|jgi:DNA invertase Pin-like site-specific DNA recombinase|nr:resolvase [Oscillospiraceae bacterium]